jgi:hypothetical protein
VWLPSERPPRQDYYLTRKDVANHILAIRHNPQAKRIVRVILIGLRTGTRLKALRGLHVCRAAGYLHTPLPLNISS